METVLTNENSQRKLEDFISWQAPAYLHYKKGWKWFSVAGIIFVSIVGYSLFNGQWISALVFVLLASVYLMHYIEPVPIIKVSISELGIHVGEKFFPYHLIKAFWIHYDPPYASKLHLKLATKSQQEVEISLAFVDPGLIRNCLLNQLPELEGMRESALNILIKLLRL